MSLLSKSKGGKLQNKTAACSARRYSAAAGRNALTRLVGHPANKLGSREPAAGTPRRRGLSRSARAPSDQRGSSGASPCQPPRPRATAPRSSSQPTPTESQQTPLVEIQIKYCLLNATAEIDRKCK